MGPLVARDTLEVVNYKQEAFMPESSIYLVLVQQPSFCFFGRDTPPALVGKSSRDFVKVAPATGQSLVREILFNTYNNSTPPPSRFDQDIAAPLWYPFFFYPRRTVRTAVSFWGRTTQIPSSLSPMVPKTGPQSKQILRELSVVGDRSFTPTSIAQ